MRKVVQNNVLSQNTVTDYANGFQYENNIIQFFPTAEGYASRLTTKFDLLGRLVKIPIEELPEDQFTYVYNYTDHLGNIRLSYAQDPDTQQLKIVEQNHYYPFGLRHTNYSGGKMQVVKEQELKRMAPTPEELLSYTYKFGGNEFQDEIGLNVYDYDNRIYDQALGRFWQMDPLAEQGRRWSPYNYCFDNPVYFLDPDGMWPFPTWKQVKAFVNSTATGAVKQLKALGNSVASAPARLAQGYSSPKAALKLMIETHPLVTAGQMIASNFTKPVNIIKKIASGDLKGAGEAYGAHLTDGGVALATMGVAKAVSPKAAPAPAAEASTETTTLYRGVNSTSPAYENATQGNATPRGGSATAAEHNAGNTNSEFTSWTTNPEVAKNYALRTSGEGVVMETTVPTSSTVKSPSAKSVNLAQGGGVVNESEVLLKGPVSGATVSPIGQ